jgi:hypothetical protein
MESSSEPRVPLTPYQLKMLRRVAAHERIPERSQRVLERLGLVQDDLFVPGYCLLTADGRAHLRDD